MTPARYPITAFPAAHQLRGPCGVPVAASVWSPPTMQPCAHLIDLAEACNEAAAPLLDDATQRVAIMETLRQHPRTFAAVDARFAEDALRANKLKLVEQLLRHLAQDADFQLFAEAKAAGGVLRVEEADRAGPVVVAREDYRPAAQAMLTQDAPKGFFARLWFARRKAA